MLVAKMAIGTLALVVGVTNWFVLAVAPLMYGHAFLTIGISPALERARSGLHLSPRRCLQLYMGAYVLAGSLAFVGAVATLRSPLSVVVAIITLVWAMIWAWMLKRLGPVNES